MRDGVITEADTCREFVTPKLVEAGWGGATHRTPSVSSAALPTAASSWRAARCGAVSRYAL